jgi:hypothetical protein
MAWCRENHPRLVVAVLTLLRAYMLAGRPSQGLAPWGSFEAWRDLIASAIVWAGGPDVMACRPTIAGKDDTETGALRMLLEHLPKCATGVSIGIMVQSLYTRERMRGEAVPDGNDALREALELLAPPKAVGQAPSAQRLGFAFRKLRRRVVGGRYLDQAEQDDRKNVARWVVREAGK